MQQQSSSIAGRWLARVLAISVLLYALLLVAVWTDTNHFQSLEATTTQKQQQHLQLVRSDVDASEGAIAGNSSSVNSTTDSLLSSETLLRTFLDSEGLSSAGIHNFTCLGWRQTGGCSPDGPREPDNDASCSKNIKAGASGYCLVRDETTGAELQVMRVNCSSMREEVRFNCRQAADFARVAPQIDALIDAKRREEEKKEETVQVATEPKNGVLMVVYPKLLASVYSTIRLLRSYGCSLPVELWYLESEMGNNPMNESRLLQALATEYGPISLRGIAQGDVDGFNSKVFALAHSELDQVLFLDADNSPVKDPTYLFAAPEFVNTGALFWPDFWHPVNTIFNVNKQSLLWELVGTPFVDMFEQESGQLLIDRRRAGVALEVVQLLALRKPDHFERLKLLHGDKDLFRLAWLKTNTSFHMIQTPAAAAGMVKAKHFCGMTMVQHDPQGDMLFLHHNGKKLIAEDANSKTRVWTHLQSFVFPDKLASAGSNAAERYAYMTTNYHVRIFGGGLFRGFPMCYGDNKMKSEHYRTTSWDELPYKDLEDRLHDFAQEAGALEH
jgi:alpha 1,2-mannosyltransferase